MANEYLTKSDIINWINDWANNNPNQTIELSSQLKNKFKGEM